MSEITGSLQAFRIDCNKLCIRKNITLSDSTFCRPGPVGVASISLGTNNPNFKGTKLGLIVSSNAILQKNIDVQEQLTQFFEIEDISIKSPWSKEEQECEEHFLKTTRLDNSQFEFTIPLKESVEKLGDSK